ncbi:MAG: sigma 54-interacting transcriptional regulator [Bacteroidales bacterium]|nr:sigma 54-interacting transcriptional regulator [Bacteroidales bacterium]
MNIDFNNYPVGIIITDSNLKITSANTAALSLLRKNEIEITKLFLYDFKFLHLDKKPFHLKECFVKNSNKEQHLFTKSLIIENDKGQDVLVILKNLKIEKDKKSIYCFTLTDISSESDCLVLAPTKELDTYSSNIIIGQNEKILELHRLISLAADTNVSVLITGESGTGKELIADAIHYQSERKDKPYIKINCSALSETLLESELFGHVKGAFTGAYKDNTGILERAHKGTVFLDEIGEISQSLQVKLLRVIQHKTIERVGENKPITVDMRIIAATNKNLRELIDKDIFREDLFYRLNVFPMYAPPLREHKNDIPLLCNHFIQKFNVLYKKKVKGLTYEANRLLLDYCWPGNVRELENVLEHAFVLVQGKNIDIIDLPQELRYLAYKKGFCKNIKENFPIMDGSEGSLVTKSHSGRLKISKENLEKILEKNQWNQSKTAKELNISRVALWKKIVKFELNKD